jgi:hypothetical protein
VPKKSVRFVKKINEDGVWKFVSLKQVQGCYECDERRGQYFLDYEEATSEGACSRAQPRARH